jgi:hypothetical protein
MDLVTVVRGLRVKDPCERLRRLCLAFLEATTKLSHGHPGYFVRGKQFALERGQGEAFACRAAPGAQAAMIASDPTRFFAPPYLAHLGWIGVNFDGADWMEIAGLVDEAYRLAAPKKLVALLDD